MTQAAPESFTLTAEHWQVLTIIADEAGCTPEQYIDEGIAMALGVTAILVGNREAGMDRTMIFLADDDTIHTGEDIEEWIKPQEEDPSKSPGPVATDDELFELLEAGFTEEQEVDVEDPFSDGGETCAISFDQRVSDEIAVAAQELAISPVAFMQLAVDLRNFVQHARVQMLMAMVQTTDEDAYLYLEM